MTMRMHRGEIAVSTRGKGLHEITRELARIVNESQIGTGLAHIWIMHTSASLIVNENADPDVAGDLEAWFARLVKDGDPMFSHTDEGPDDMSAHIRSVLTATSMTIPVEAGRPRMGTWQGLFVWEHRARPHTRRVVITVQGE